MNLSNIKMTYPDDVKKGGQEPEITITNVVPEDHSGAPFVIASSAPPQAYNGGGGGGAAAGEPPIPAGHHRFYCSTCRTVRA